MLLLLVQLINLLKFLSFLSSATFNNLKNNNNFSISNFKFSTTSHLIIKVIILFLFFLKKITSYNLVDKKI